MNTPRLARDFYDRPTLVVARELLGQRLVRVFDGRRLSGLIVETEAYIGPDDQASHAYRNPSGRAAIMFGPPGFAYVYKIYGVHHCLNVVSESEGFPAAILIRGLRPEEGLEEMYRRRGVDGGVTGRPRRVSTASGIADGPGKLCQALSIDLALNGTDLVAGEELFFETGPGFADDRVCTGPRIGVRGDELAVTRPWRFYVE